MNFFLYFIFFLLNDFFHDFFFFFVIVIIIICVWKMKKKCFMAKLHSRQCIFEEDISRCKVSTLKSILLLFFLLFNSCVQIIQFYFSIEPIFVVFFFNKIEYWWPFFMVFDHTFLHTHNKRKNRETKNEIWFEPVWFDFLKMIFDVVQFRIKIYLRENRNLS